MGEYIPKMMPEYEPSYIPELVQRMNAKYSRSIPPQGSLIVCFNSDSGFLASRLDALHSVRAFGIVGEVAPNGQVVIFWTNSGRQHSGNVKEVERQFSNHVWWVLQ